MRIEFASFCFLRNSLLFCIGVWGMLRGLGSVARKLCHCRSYASAQGSTSAHTLDSPFPSFETLTSTPPVSPAPPSSSPSSPSKKQKRHARQFPLALLLSTPPQHSAPTTFSSSTNKERKGKQVLSLITRERNHLLSILHREIHAASPDPDKVWEAIVNVLRYPSVRPSLPPTYHATFDVSTIDPETGEETEDPRRGIPLSLPELRKSFSILSSVRPPTRGALSRLVVLVELLAMRSAKILPDARGGSFVERETRIGDLRGGGVGLRERDWHSLMLFAGRCYRSPRVEPDVNSAISLFTQWTSPLRTPAGRKLIPTLPIYNTLLKLAVSARSWGLYEAIVSRMVAESIEGDIWSLRIRLGKENRRGEHVGIIWGTFVEGIGMLGGRADARGLWNEMIWVYAGRGMMEEARRMYDAMNTCTTLIDLANLAPLPSQTTTDEIPRSFPSLLVRPPGLSTPTYSALVQAYAHQGDLIGALKIIRDLVAKGNENGTGQPTVQMFASLFRGFAVHSVGGGIDRVRISGRSVGENRKAVGVGEERLGRMTEKSLEEDLGETLWIYSTLQTLTSSFLALTPPSSFPHNPKSTLSLARRIQSTTRRTSPSSKTLFWLLLAHEKLSGGDAREVLDVWERVESKFAEGREGWSGWRVDERMRRKVEGIRGRIRAEEESEEG